MTPEMKTEHACCSCLLAYKGSSWIFFKDWDKRRKARTLCYCLNASSSQNGGVSWPAEQLAFRVGRDLPCAALTHFHGANTLKMASFNLPSSNSSWKPFGIVSWLYLLLNRWNPVWILLPLDLCRGKGMLTTSIEIPLRAHGWNWKSPSLSLDCSSSCHFPHWAANKFSPTK